MDELVFNSKKIKEIEHLHDREDFEERGRKQDSEQEQGDSLSWRRALVEEAVGNVKRATARPVDPNIAYEKGSMLYDREARKYARVVRSIPGGLAVEYVAGGNKEWGNFDVDTFLTEYAASRKLTEIVAALELDEKAVLKHLKRLKLSTADMDAQEAVQSGQSAQTTAAQAAPSRPSPAVEEMARMLAEAALAEDGLVASQTEANEDPVELNADVSAESQAAPSESNVEPAEAKTKAKPKPKKTKPAAESKPKGDTEASASSPELNSKEEVNQYIQEHYLKMSNKELAGITGLSPHTIRRKLGEWGLKRPRKGKN